MGFEAQCRESLSLFPQTEALSGAVGLCPSGFPAPLATPELKASSCHQKLECYPL